MNIVGAILVIALIRANAKTVLIRANAKTVLIRAITKTVLIRAITRIAPTGYVFSINFISSLLFFSILRASCSVVS